MNINDLVDSLLVEVPGCPSATVRDQLRWAQRELCSEGSAWLSRESPVVAGADTDLAEVEAPPRAEALRIVSLHDGRNTLRPGRDYEQTGSNEVLFLRGRPSSAELSGVLACRPAYGQDMPAELIARWAEALMDGARYRILLLPQPWRDPALAEYYRNRFLDAQCNARQLASAGYQSGSVRMGARRLI